VDGCEVCSSGEVLVGVFDECHGAALGGTADEPGAAVRARPGGLEAALRHAAANGFAHVLSAGVDHATFLGQVETSMANGASGVIAGRSLWKDCISLDRAVTRARLEQVAVPRLREIYLDEMRKAAV
jgi:hypothetical protein